VLKQIAPNDSNESSLSHGLGSLNQNIAPKDQAATVVAHKAIAQCKMTLVVQNSCSQVDVQVRRSSDSLSAFSPGHEEYNDSMVLKVVWMAAVILSLQWPVHKYCMVERDYRFPQIQ